MARARLAGSPERKIPDPTKTGVSECSEWGLCVVHCAGRKGRKQGGGQRGSRQEVLSDKSSVEPVQLVQTSGKGVSASAQT